MAVEITKEQRDTIEYYNTYADEYCAATRNVDMSVLYAEFEKYLKPGCKILDLGCGSGRDSKYFYDKGYEVVAADPSTEMCKKTRELVPIDVLELRAEDLEFENEFDAIWACASLLHVNREDMPITLEKIMICLKRKGVLYASWKNGTGSFVEFNRTFTNYFECEIEELVFQCKYSKIKKIWTTTDTTKRNIIWINSILEHP